MNKTAGYGSYNCLKTPLTLIWFMIFLLMLILSGSAHSGQFSAKIDAELIRYLNECESGRFIPVELAVTGGLSANDLTRELNDMPENLDQRRRYGLKRLRETTAAAQARLKTFLNRLERSGLARNIRCHWLTNTISVELKVSAVDSVARRTDIETIFQYPELHQIEPVESSPSIAKEYHSSAGVEPNIVYVGADSAWRMGYTGEGRIVCVFDYSGIDGSHPALYDNWKGHDGDSAAAWHDDGNFPTAHGYHGTHMAGIMVGHDDETGDTIGVAPGAKWIGGWYDFEWAADPDGDPNTTADMPDAISVSIGTGFNCSDRWWDLIDMVEALGIVVAFSAGNDGPGPYTVHSPGDRAEDSLTNFAVGSVDHRDSNIRWSSSRGPSPCDSVSIKPNICAPGVAIWSSVDGGGYDFHGGTSMAVPHVAGAVAILRQYAPNATTREIKEALLAGAVHYGHPYPNNNYGWGIMNIPASMEFLDGQFRADLRVVAFDYEQAEVDDTLKAAICLTNRGHPVDSVYVACLDDHNGISVLSDSIYFGRMERYDTARGDELFRCLFDDTLYAGPVIPVRMVAIGSGNNVDTITVNIQAGIEGERSFATHKTDRLHFTISNFGQYGFGRYSANPLGHSGFTYGDTTRNCLYEAALMIGHDPDHVSDGFRTVDLENDDDFWCGAENRLEEYRVAFMAGQGTRCEFDDGRAERRIGVGIKQKTYSWDYYPNDNFVIMEYQMTNISRKNLENLFVGLIFDWIYPRPGCDTVSGSGYSAAYNLGYLFAQPCARDTGQFRGLAVLNDEGVHSYRVLKHPFYPDSGLTEADKYAALVEGIVDTGLIAGFRDQLMHVISTGPFSLAPGETDTAVFAVIGADSLSELEIASSYALKRWHKVKNFLNMPSTFTLKQNYPNPFNAATTINFNLPVRTHVTIDIYNILGQRVIRLIDKELPEGYHETGWNGSDERGNDVASGVYFYRIRTGSFDKSRKMILLR